ncbi:CPBP family intramembrane glutamic endopeptidase [Acetanaerobacterium elongatum]|uniref:CAAX prenyl protease 2/Lysostaphin resistance protein A-like domain-containing protein n=1 Tax=Acetanaerobacterium elongatum TaxID=258515 RepID=A0A1G9X9P9_9FIRM|nr:CPBP family intramembrane glutamic endopeptidase [Acetanaerobacterium elongatum]SDM93387.1 hypothetical protein SAMN05192585_1085 [Acetanaerobacterium elongatum]
MKTTKQQPVALIAVLFLLCFVIRLIEVLGLRLDETFINENFIHKLLGIAILAAALRWFSLSQKDIGFDFSRFFLPTLLGLALGAGRFAVGYGAECLILAAQGKSPSFEFYASGFSLTGEQLRLPAYAFLLIIGFNILNAIMEEGIFRGLFIRLAQRKHRFAAANLIAALFFGLWHIAMPIRSYLDGAMPLGVMLLYALGYILLSGSISLLWGMLFEMSGVLWIGLADHFFNNTILNTLHVTTASGTDELQIVRTLIAQLLALALVTVLYLRKKKTKRTAEAV